MSIRLISGLLPVAAVVLVIAAGPAAAGRKPADVSWGKPNVSFAAYQRDTLDCANQTYGLDVGMKRDTMDALGAQNAASLASFVADRSFYQRGNGGRPTEQVNYFAALSSVEPGQIYFRNTTYQGLFHNAARTDVIDQLQTVLDYCLTQRGYERFRLNADQRRALNREPKESAARAHLLHALGSDPQVLATQHL